MIVKHISQGIGPKDGTLRLLGIWDTVLNKGEMFKPHIHHGVEEAYYILEGRGEMFIQGESKEVTSGDIVYIPPESVHFIRARGEQLLRVVTVSIDVRPGARYSINLPSDYQIQISKN